MKIVFFVIGALIFTVALLDYFNVPLEIPTSNNRVNLAIGVGIMAVPWIPGLHGKGK
jgi:hypothetical protein